MIRMIKKLFHKHEYSYIGRYYSTKLAKDLDSYDFTLYKVWYCACGRYEIRKLHTNNVGLLQVNETFSKYDCQGIGQLGKLRGDIVEIR